MKVKELRIKNFRKVSDAKLPFDKSLILLYGEIQQGKTTFLDSIKILFQAGFPDDLIQHGETEASIELELENGLISRSFYKNKEGEIVGRPLSAIVNNKKLSVREIVKLFNPFQLNQDYLKKMTPPERKKEFIKIFNIDTTEIDNQITTAENKAKDLRSEIKGFGQIDLTETI